jgi:hypothetical protein
MPISRAKPRTSDTANAPILAQAGDRFWQPFSKVFFFAQFFCAVRATNFKTFTGEGV